MALPSQTARNVTGQRPYSRGTTRRAARRNLQLLAVFLLAVVAGLIYGGWRIFGQPATTDAAPRDAAGVAAGSASELPVVAPARPDPAPEPPPVDDAIQVDLSVPDVGATSAGAMPQGETQRPMATVLEVDAVQAEVAAEVTPPPAVAPEPAKATIPDTVGEGQSGAAVTTAQSVQASPSRPVITALETTAPASPASPSTDVVIRALSKARTHVAAGRSLQARVTLSRLLQTHGHQLQSEKARTVQRQINRLGDRLLMSRRVVAGDPLVEHYTVPAGDTFGKIGLRYRVPYPLIMAINGIKVDTALRAGQEIKVVRGPFHAIITKHTYRMDVFAEDDRGQPLFVASFDVGLGADDSTPVGQWIVRHGKQKNPDWRNPRTNEYFSAGDPKNPIGEFWIPLQGADDQTRGLNRYGVHGTIDPESIGKQASMGCVRLRPKDIQRVYNLLTENLSRVTIQP